MARLDPDSVGLLGALNALEKEREELKSGNRLRHLLALARSGIDKAYFSLSQEEQRSTIRGLCGGISAIDEDEVTAVWSMIDQLPKEAIHQGDNE